MPDLETNSDGGIILKPVTGWKILPVAGMSALLAIQYVETPEELEKGNSKQIQLVLMPQQCLGVCREYVSTSLALRLEIH